MAAVTLMLLLLVS